MKIDRSNLKRIHDNYSELQDGLFAIVDQGHFVIDSHVCRGVRGEESDREFFVTTVYEWNVDGEHPEVSNFSFHENLAYERYIETDVVIFDTRAEMLEHFMQFIAKHNCF